MDLMSAVLESPLDRNLCLPLCPDLLRDVGLLPWCGSTILRCCNESMDMTIEVLYLVPNVGVPGWNCMIKYLVLVDLVDVLRRNRWNLVIVPISSMGNDMGLSPL